VIFVGLALANSGVHPDRAAGKPGVDRGDAHRVSVLDL
jgi:hypothetical protein